MKCPRDGTELERVTFMGFELDKCHQCDGIWCDRGELETLRDRKMVGAEEVIEAKYGDPTFAKAETDGYMQCPRCDGRLRSYNCSYVKPVRVDTCEHCNGIWLDDGELDEIIGQKKGLDDEYSVGRLSVFLRSVANLLKGA